ncbi:dTMP kinase [Bartonella sp. HY406]|uniref:dTMP kinase n=1 Tax=Bartonella sp. HY406 TaxID=2979331 RepID=UPI0021C853FF|nr:dTMP kinase [Bartonella sp. HY406]UXN04253.1 dTMP kinase [Bartonella sp. HY406]
MQQGFFISFEGGEGAGKSTQIKRLAKALEQKGYDLVITREPGGTAGAEAVRYVLLSGYGEKYGASLEAALFAAARADHIDVLIEPALKSGKIVLCDRFIDSTRVYQGTASPQLATTVDALEQAAIKNIRPNITFILDLPAEVGLARANSRRSADSAVDRFEKDDVLIHENRRQAFLDIAQKEPDRCVIIDAEGDIDQIANEILSCVEQKLHQTQ